ncbi:MAG: ATP-grasp domain-containing protein [Myxococcaceae bacterium]|nr:ATP-grasp domain-containing protein [Myxococcaceae bacterium]MCA3014002.1 ATP-grasp domain-containing protein [Myxococcaceae bacterium]
MAKGKLRVGLFGTDDDPQVHAVAREIRALGAEDVLLRADALDVGLPVSERDGRLLYRGVDVTEVPGVYLRSIPAAYAPAMERDDELVLYEDWFERYMQERERASFYVAWLLELQRRGARLVNGPTAASVLQYKPFQLNVLRSLGAPVPRTLLSNDPDAVRAFHAEVKDVIYKPLTGGAVTRALDDETLAQLEAVRAAPVIFQERIAGDDLRVMLAGDDVVSSVAIRTPSQHLDFRDDPVYSSGDAGYEPVELPEGVVRQCRAAARACNLVFAGIDIKRTPDGRWVFLELNSSPIYLDVELKLGHPISRAIAELVVGVRAPH